MYEEIQLLSISYLEKISFCLQMPTVKLCGQLQWYWALLNWAL